MQAPDPGLEADADSGVAKAKAPKTSRAKRLGSGPSSTDLDQLLDEPPRGEYHLGRFAGYVAGRRVRRGIALAFALCGVAMVTAFVQHQLELRARYAAAHYDRLHPWKLPAGTDVSSRSRDFHWSSGKMRIALSREAPGIERIVLPDKIITLAPGVDLAQIKFEVVDGHTLDIKILSGDIEHRKRLPHEEF